MKLLVVILAAALGAGCTSKKKAAYENVAAAVNPLLRQLQPVAQQVLALDEHQLDLATTAVTQALEDADKGKPQLTTQQLDAVLAATLPATVHALDARAAKVVQVCRAEALWKLRDVNLQSVSDYAYEPAVATPRYAAELLDEWPRRCHMDRDGGDPIWVLHCARFCRGMYAILAEEVDDLRKDAASVDVEIVSLH